MPLKSTAVVQWLSAAVFVTSAVFLCDLCGQKLFNREAGKGPREGREENSA
jgi:hypothetical protein